MTLGESDVWKGCDTASNINANMIRVHVQVICYCQEFVVGCLLCRVYRNDCVSVLSHARSRRHLKVLESVHIIFIYSDQVWILLFSRSHSAPVSAYL